MHFLLVSLLVPESIDSLSRNFFAPVHTPPLFLRVLISFAARYPCFSNPDFSPATIPAGLVGQIRFCFRFFFPSSHYLDLPPKEVPPFLANRPTYVPSHDPLKAPPTKGHWMTVVVMFSLFSPFASLSALAPIFLRSGQPTAYVPSNDSYCLHILLYAPLHPDASPKSIFFFPSEVPTNRVPPPQVTALYFFVRGFISVLQTFFVCFPRKP